MGNGGGGRSSRRWGANDIDDGCNILQSSFYFNDVMARIKTTGRYPLSLDRSWCLRSFIETGYLFARLQTLEQQGREESERIEHHDISFLTQPRLV